LDNAVSGTLAYLFLFALPCSAFCSAVCLVAAGPFGDAEGQPLVFRFAARAGFLPGNARARFVIGSVGLAFVNLGPILYLFRPPAGTAVGLFWAYFVVLALWSCYAGVVAARVGNSGRSSITAPDEPGLTSLPRSRYQARIDQLDFEDSLDRASPAANADQLLAGRPGRPSGGPGPTQTVDELGEPCAVYEVEWPGSTILPAKLDIQDIADTFQGAMVLELAKALDPRFPVAGSHDPALVVRSRVLRADPGNQALRWLLSTGVGGAVFEVEAQIADKGALLAHVHAEGKRRWGAPFGGQSHEMLADCAKLAGERAAKQLLEVLAARKVSS
jgi:hypothetical protein